MYTKQYCVISFLHVHMYLCTHLHHPIFNNLPSLALLCILTLFLISLSPQYKLGKSLYDARELPQFAWDVSHFIYIEE